MEGGNVAPMSAGEEKMSVRAVFAAAQVEAVTNINNPQIFFLVYSIIASERLVSPSAHTAERIPRTRMVDILVATYNQCRELGGFCLFHFRG
jgi:hypothetical protein